MIGVWGCTNDAPHSCLMSWRTFNRALPISDAQIQTIMNCYRYCNASVGDGRGIVMPFMMNVLRAITMRMRMTLARMLYRQC